MWWAVCSCRCVTAHETHPKQEGMFTCRASVYGTLPPVSTCTACSVGHTVRLHAASHIAPCTAIVFSRAHAGAHRVEPAVFTPSLCPDSQVLTGICRSRGYELSLLRRQSGYSQGTHHG